LVHDKQGFDGSKGRKSGMMVELVKQIPTRRQYVDITPSRQSGHLQYDSAGSENIDALTVVNCLSAQSYQDLTPRPTARRTKSKQRPKTVNSLDDSIPTWFVRSPIQRS
jgi:hypothetical protein